jgi:DNA-binding LacI/PurR family transcriptional regulator
MVELLESGRPMTAIVCQNDHMAMGAIRALQERNLRVPDDYSIVGCDDIDFARFITPPLTTVRISFEQTGVAAVRLLIDRLRGEEPIPERITLPSTLVVRESTRALP